MTRIQVNIPTGKIGKWSIRKAIGDSPAYGISPMFSGIMGQPSTYREEPFGEYTFLCHDDIGPIMQDTTHEYIEHQPLWDEATGNVLIGGLGIGLVNEKLINYPNVTSITIVEKNQEVIDLVWNHCPKDERFSLVHADIDSWITPEGSRWNYAWFDTWIGDNSIQTQNEYNQMLIQKYSEYCDKIGIWTQSS
jgi:hypothetical protein